MKNENFSCTLQVFRNDDTLCESTTHINGRQDEKERKENEGKETADQSTRVTNGIETSHSKPAW